MTKLIKLKKEVQDNLLKAKHLGMSYKAFNDRIALLKKQAEFLRNERSNKSTAA